MKRSLWQESFVPVMLVVLAIFVSLLFAQYEAAKDADRAIEIVIEDSGQKDVEAPDEEADVTIAISDHDPERARIFALVENKHWAEAEEAFKSRLVEKESSETLADLGTLYYRQGDFDQAQLYLDKAVAMKPVYAGAYFQRGLLFSKEKELEKAIGDYQQQIKLTPFHFEAHYNLGILQLKTKQYLASVQTFEAAAKLAGGTRKAKVFYNLGLVFHKLGEGYEQQARGAFHSAIRLKPDYIAPRFGLASLEPANKEGWGNTLKLYEIILRLRPNYAQAYFRMGLAYSALGDTKATIKAYRKAIKYDPSYVKAHFNLGLKLIDKRQLTEALQQFEWVLQRNPKHAKSYFNLGRISKYKKDYAAALKYYQKAISLRNGDYPAAMVNMGLIYFGQQKYNQAIKAYNEAIHLRPNYAKAWYQLGLTQLQETMPAEAENSLKIAIKHKANYYQAWTALGGFYVQEDRLNDAVSAYQQALTLRFDYQPAQLALADLYYQQQDYVKALSLYKALLADYPNFGIAWAKLGIVYEAMGQHSEAKKSLLEAIQLNPEDIESKRVLAKVMLTLKQPRKAVELLRTVLEADSGRPELYLEYAETLNASGKTSAARGELEKGLKLDPGNLEIMKAMKMLKK